MSENIIIFNKSYEFEGQTYTELDLSKIEDLTSEDLEKADKAFNALRAPDALKEMSMAYVNIIAAQITNKPIEFFKSLPAKEAIKIKAVVASFFFN